MTTQNETQTSILDYIKANIEDGELPKEFSLTPFEKPFDPENFDVFSLFAPGARDGVCLLHVAPHEPSEKEASLIARAVQAASECRFSEADQLFLELDDSCGVIGFTDALQAHIRKNIPSIDADMLYDYADECISHSCQVLLPKVGMLLLECFSNADIEEETKDKVRSLALCSEFTLFALWNMQGWQNGTEEIFRLAPHVYEWGRMHVIRELEPTTDEMRHWLMFDAMDDTVVGHECAVECMAHSGAAELLLSGTELSHEEYKAIGRIFDSVLCNLGDGLYDLELFSDLIVCLYLEQSAKQPLDLEDYELISRLMKAGEYAGACYQEQCAALLAGHDEGGVTHD